MASFEHSSCSNEPGTEDESTDSEMPLSTDLLHINPNSNQLTDSLLINKSTKKLSQTPPSTFRVPKSSLLQQVKSFLPMMAEAQKVLEKQMESAPSTVNIENCEESESVIEMNVALVEQEDSDSDSDSELSSLSDHDEIVVGQSHVTEENFKVKADINHASKPLIEEVSGKSTHN